MRVLCKQNECPICRRLNQKVIFFCAKYSDFFCMNQYLLLHFFFCITKGYIYIGNSTI